MGTKWDCGYQTQQVNTIDLHSTFSQRCRSIARRRYILYMTFLAHTRKHKGRSTRTPFLLQTYYLFKNVYV